MKLFPKLTLGIGGLILGVTLALSLSFYWREERSLREQGDAERRGILRNLVLIAQESFLTNDDLLLIKYAGWLQKWNPTITSASVVDQNGDVLAHSEPARIGKESTETGVQPTQVLVLSEPVRVGNHLIATASVGFSEKLMQEAFDIRRSALQKKTAIMAGVAVFIGALIAFWVSLSWTRPIQVLARAAQRVGTGKYHIELEQLPARRDELGQFTRTFQQMTLQLQELDRMKEDFVSAVTHELRSPLGAIESYLNVIEEERIEGISPTEWQTYLQRLRLNTQRLNRFINDLLDVAALERGKVTLQFAPVAMGPLIQDVLALFSPRMAERKIVVRTDISPALPSVQADEDKVRQILTNLLSNAIKFTPVGGTIEIGTEHRGSDGHIRIYVQDSGIGIAEDDQKKLFNKFEQVVSARPAVKGPKGTGLGLSICRALVELHGGIIGLISTPGEGSRFYFTLPVAKQSAKPLAPVTGGLL